MRFHVWLLIACILSTGCSQDKEAEQIRVRKQLSDLGIKYSTDDFFDRIRNADVTACSLFAKSGYDINRNFPYQLEIKIPGSVQSLSTKEISPMMAAVALGQNGIVEEFIKHGGRVSTEPIPLRAGMSEFEIHLFPFLTGDKKIVGLMFDSGLDPKWRDKEYKSLAHYVCMGAREAKGGEKDKFIATLDLIKARGGKILEKDHAGQTPLELLINNDEYLTYLKQNGDEAIKVLIKESVEKITLGKCRNAVQELSHAVRRFQLFDMASPDFSNKEIENGALASYTKTDITIHGNGCFFVTNHASGSWSIVCLAHQNTENGEPLRTLEIATGKLATETAASYGVTLSSREKSTPNSASPASLLTKEIEGWVTGDDVNIRESPSLEGKVIARKNKGEKVIALEGQGEWFKVRFDSGTGQKTGYVFNRYLSLAPVEPDRKFDISSEHFQVAPSEIVDVKFVRKTLIPADPMAGRYNAYLRFTFEIINNSTKPIRGIEGVGTFSDMFDNEIIKSRLSFEIKMDGKSNVMNSDNALEMNMFLRPHKELAAKDDENIKFEFLATNVLFAGGE